ncbi:MAG: NAD(P)-dependent oxidoreductase [Myxococcota bacterium]
MLQTSWSCGIRTGTGGLSEVEMNVTILGLGAMGSRVAARAVAAGHAVRTYTRSAREVAGAEAVSTPREAATGADVVISMLTDIAASRAVWQDAAIGALAGMSEGAVAIECSTLTPAATITLRDAAAAVGVRFVEAPVVGTRPHAEQGILSILAGGPPEVVDEVRPVLETFGKVVPVGEVGEAMAAKLAVNAMFAGQVVLLSEVLAILQLHDVGLDRGLALLEATPVFAPVLGGIAALLRAGDDAPRFPVALVEKDLGYAAGHGDLPLLEAVRARYAAAIAQSLGDRNIQAVAGLVLDTSSAD